MILTDQLRRIAKVPAMTEPTTDKIICEQAANRIEELIEEIAKLREQLADVSIARNDASYDVYEWQQRAEVAAAKLKVESEQEPLSGWFSYHPIDGKLERCDHRCGREVFRLYTAPIPPADVQELRLLHEKA